jgi:hypothetical protein
MKYSNFLAVAMLCAGFLSNATFCSPEPSKRYFEWFLENSCYAPHVIKYLREEYAEYVAEINDILESHYIAEYRRAIANKETRIEKLMMLGRIGEHLILSPYSIARGQEGPALEGSDDGSDRGVSGLRMQAFLKVRDEIYLMEE